MGAFYVVQESGIQKTDDATFFEKGEGICVMTLEEWQSELKWREQFQIWHRVDAIHYCKLESYRDFLYGTMYIPGKEERDMTAFALYLAGNRLILLGEDNGLEEYIKEFHVGIHHEEYSIQRFLYDFLQSFLTDDILYLEKLEEEIAQIEEKVLGGQDERFNYQMLKVKKAISGYYHYYVQLSQFGEELQENAGGFWGGEELHSFAIYTDRVIRLADETKMLREYAMQVQEVYQSEISIRQNSVMKMLTVVTTIFLPLSLIAAWYGMNFSYMPELHYRYAYPIVIGCSVFIVMVSLFLFKKKKYW